MARASRFRSTSGLLRGKSALHFQRGTASLEYAIILAIGIIPLLYLTFSGIMLFTVKQAMELAATEGARAALQYGTANERQSNACSAAANSMAWLLAYIGQKGPATSICSAPKNNVIGVTGPTDCPDGSAPNAQCLTVIITYDYLSHPFLPATTTFAGLVLKDNQIVSSATVQLNPDDLSASP